MYLGGLTAVFEPSNVGTLALGPALLHERKVFFQGEFVEHIVLQIMAHILSLAQQKLLEEGDGPFCPIVLLSQRCYSVFVKRLVAEVEGIRYAKGTTLGMKFELMSVLLWSLIYFFVQKFE